MSLNKKDGSVSGVDQSNYFSVKLKNIVEKYDNIGKLLSTGTLSPNELKKLSKEYSDMMEIAEKSKHFLKLLREKTDLEKELMNYSLGAYNSGDYKYHDYDLSEVQKSGIHQSEVKQSESQNLKKPDDSGSIDLGVVHKLPNKYSNTSPGISSSALSSEMINLMKDELFELKTNLSDLQNEIKILLLPVDEDDIKNSIVEIRSGTGGEEASLFANNLFEMYTGYAGVMGWKYEVLNLSQTDLGGIREIIILIQGRNVFGKLKFESGVHRVQRVPVTEASGRIHTSTATVAVLPETQEIDVQINDEDIRIDLFRSSGNGGQSVNTTDSAVRITHLPTGIVVSQQDEKSQHKNKTKAMRILQARIYDMEKQKRDSERSMDRKSQIGTGDRSERIRTYNYHDNRVTDHRINLTIYKLNQIITGECLNEVIDALLTEDRAAKLLNS